MVTDIRYRFRERVAGIDAGDRSPAPSTICAVAVKQSAGRRRSRTERPYRRHSPSTSVGFELIVAYSRRRSRGPNRRRRRQRRRRGTGYRTGVVLDRSCIVVVVSSACGKTGRFSLTILTASMPAIAVKLICGRIKSLYYRRPLTYAGNVAAERRRSDSRRPGPSPRRRRFRPRGACRSGTARCSDWVAARVRSTGAA